MLLNTALNLIEILAQPVILKTNAGIRIGLRCCLTNQRIKCFDFMGDPRQYLAFTICISIGKLNRQCGSDQP